MLALAQAYMARGNVSEDGSESADHRPEEGASTLRALCGQEGRRSRRRPQEALVSWHSSRSSRSTRGSATPAGALSDWNRIVELQPGSVQNWLFLATAAIAADKTGVALLAYGKALDLDPKGEFADEIRSQIKELKAQIKTQARLRRARRRRWVHETAHRVMSCRPQ